jgi:CHASE3 domain sensor protein
MIRRIRISAYAIGFLLMLGAVVVMYVALKESDGNHAISRADRKQLRDDQDALRRSVDEAILAGRGERRLILEAIRRVEAKLDRNP